MDIDRFPSVTQVRQSPPGELAVWLSTMSADAVSGLGVDAAEAVVMATQRVSSWAAAMQAVAVDRFAEHVLDAQEHHAADLMSARDAQREEVEAAGGVWRGDRGAIALPEPEQVAASMLAPELRISPRTMRTRLNRARWLTELPTTLGLALAGDLEPWRVDAVVAAAADVDAKHLVEFEARLFAGDVAALPKPRLVERARSAAARADAESVARGQARAPRRRSVRVGASQVPGVMRWTADLPDEVSRRMFAAIDALAQEYLAADRVGATSMKAAARGVRRTVDPFLSHRPPPPSPADPDPPPRVTDLTGAPVWFVPGLVQTPGVGALLPDQVAALLNDPDTGVRIIDGTPGSADGGLPQRRTYRPHAALAAKVRARDGHCRFPGCSVQARRCHLDHVVAFPAGQTEEANLQALCPAHHGFKHHAGWGVTMTPDGVCTWTTPSGRTHITRPPDLCDTAA